LSQRHHQRRHRRLRRHRGGEVLMRRPLAARVTMGPHAAPNPGALARALAALAIALTAGSAMANEPDSYGLGSRPTAMGGAMAADATDSPGNYYTPAALAGARDLSLSLGYPYAWNRLAIDGKDSGVSNVHGLVGGLALPGKLWGVPFAFGVGLYMPDA